MNTHRSLTDIPIFWLCVAIATFDICLGIYLATIELKLSVYLLIGAGAVALVLAILLRRTRW